MKEFSKINKLKAFIVTNMTDTLNPPDPNPMGPANKRDTPLDWLNYTKIDGMCTLKHDTR